MQSSEDHADDSAGLIEGHATILVRTSTEEPVRIQTKVRVYATEQDAQNAYDADKAAIEQSYSTEPSTAGDEAFYWERGTPWVLLELRQGNVVWSVDFRGQYGYYWDPSIEDVGELLAAKY